MMQGLLHAVLLDGQGGARHLSGTSAAELSALLRDAERQETLWLHLDRSRSEVQEWLRAGAGLSEFTCNVLLEENTRPRALPVSAREWLIFMRGINLNPNAEPADMVTLRILAACNLVISLRMRPLGAGETILQALGEGKGPLNSSELVLGLAEAMTERTEQLIVDSVDLVDQEEEYIELDRQYRPDMDGLAGLRLQISRLRRFLLPQKEIFMALSRGSSSGSWIRAEDATYWNELGNRLQRYLEDLEVVRERVHLILDSEERRLSEQMNRTMYLLAIITAFFLPISFLTGLLGINVGGMPGTDSPWGFSVVVLAVLGIALVQAICFRWLKWF